MFVEELIGLYPGELSHIALWDHLVELVPAQRSELWLPIFRRFAGGSGMVKTLVTGLWPLRMVARGSQFGKPANLDFCSNRRYDPARGL